MILDENRRKLTAGSARGAWGYIDRRMKALERRAGAEERIARAEAKRLRKRQRNLAIAARHA